MKIHPAVKNVEEVKTVATKVGLDQIDFSKYYSLVKTGAKKSSRFGIPDKAEVQRGYVSILGDREGKYAWIYCEGPSDWFVTSPVLSVKKIKGGYEFETENSFYKLLSREEIFN